VTLHTVIRTYRIDDGDIDEAMHRVDERLAPALSHEPGFVAYECLKSGENGICSITTFQDEGGCDRSTELAAKFVAEELSDMRLTRLDTMAGEVMVSRAAREVLEPAHH
jgi:hypothetical protein